MARSTVLQGPAFVQDNGTDKPQTIRFIGPSRVLAPIHFFRIHSIILDGKFDVMSFLVPNQPALDPDVTKYLVSVDRIEAVAGLTFFGSLPKAGCAIVKSTTTSRSRASPASF